MKASELILNPDGSLYHLGLKPGDCAPLVITVGDPERVSTVARHFDTVSYSHQTREIHTQTGMLSGRPISVISTGMGTDNIDIVFNELDALFNMDLQSGTPSPTHTQLTFIRLGTSGAIQSDIPIDSIIVAQTAIGFDNLLHYYDLPTHPMAKALTAYLSVPESISNPYGVDADAMLVSVCRELGFDNGVIATNSGFYGPQLRQLRLQPKKIYSLEQLTYFSFQNQSITHFDMESSGIYGLSQLMGHKAVSISAILANRSLGSFSSDPSATVDKMIRKVVDGIATGKFD